MVVNKNESTLKMYVRPEHINDIFKAHVKQTGPEPYVVVEIGSVDNLETILNQAIKTKKRSLASATITRRAMSSPTFC